MRGRIVQYIALFLFVFALNANACLALTTNAQPIEYKSKLFFSPATYSVTTNSEFEVSLYIDTLGFSINGVDVKINFDPDKLSVVDPSSGESVIGLWVASPQYSNTRGELEFSGIIPGGTKTNNGLVERIKFRAKSPGLSAISVGTSHVLINDGFGSEASIETTPVKVTIEPSAPAGVAVVSGTHPFSDQWSNNKDPVFSWSGEKGESYSYVMDSAPFTVPDDTLEGTDTQVGFNNVKDGVWYFHIKSRLNGIWSETTHYQVRIDTAPPALFTPTVDFVSGGSHMPGLISFFTTDALSGVAHYEVGVLDKDAESDTLPAFVQSASPFYLPQQVSKNLLVTVRATDNAGNVRDITLNLQIPSPFELLAKEYAAQATVGASVVVLICGLWLTMRAGRRRRYGRDVNVEELKMLLDEAVQRRYLAAPTRIDVKEPQLVRKITVKRDAIEPVARLPQDYQM